MLVGYPTGKQALEERCLWTHYEAHGSPVVVLTHTFSMKTGDFYGVCQRRFYVTGSYNAEQAVAGIFPIAGGTAVACVNRTFTDQLTGSGGSAKCFIGSMVLASQLQAPFTKFSNVAAQWNATPSRSSSRAPDRSRGRMRWSSPVPGLSPASDLPSTPAPGGTSALWPWAG